MRLVHGDLDRVDARKRRENRVGNGAVGGDLAVPAVDRILVELGENIRVMLDSTKLLYDPATMRNYTMSEYILKSS